MKINNYKLKNAISNYVRNVLNEKLSMDADSAFDALDNDSAINQFMGIQGTLSLPNKNAMIAHYKSAFEKATREGNQDIAGKVKSVVSGIPALRGTESQIFSSSGGGSTTTSAAAPVPVQADPTGAPNADQTDVTVEPTAAPTKAPAVKPVVKAPVAKPVVKAPVAKPVVKAPVAKPNVPKSTPQQIAMVREIQGLLNMPQDGIYGSKTKRAVNAAYAQANFSRKPYTNFDDKLRSELSDVRSILANVSRMSGKPVRESKIFSKEYIQQVIREEKQKLINENIKKKKKID